ncbi:MAG: hypothetical protein M1834_007718 [Cirrosporium novae-zelandiae]|nr:MAG: hypothetical protein M1834_007718 [Cirrosporium novae-zelandiae]
MSNKRPSSSEGRQPERLKVVKIDGQPPDFSTPVRKRIQSSTRTGQACDRCRVRKMKCDSKAGGCGPCQASKSQCVTTDRITGRPNSRGYVAALETENQMLRAQVDNYHARLLAAGLDPRDSPFQYPPPKGDNPPSATSPSYSPPEMVGPYLQINPFAVSPVQTPPAGQGLFGLSCSPDHGTKLKVLGLEIDIADFSSPDMDEPEDVNTQTGFTLNKSCMSAIHTVCGKNTTVARVDLLPEEMGLKHAKWYFMVINPFFPVLHEPTFMALLTRHYDEPGVALSAAEDIMIHMVFAVMFYQSAARNRDKQPQIGDVNQQSNDHYHYCLSRIPELIAKPTWQDIQALAMICLHLRSFPKPGCFSILSSVTLTLAIDLGMHRSFERTGQAAHSNPLEMEMRKRIFWSILSMLVMVSGKLGRPMPVSFRDFDIEIPQPIPDQQLSATGIDPSKPGKCSYLMGIELFKSIPVMAEIYRQIHRSHDTPVEQVRILDQKIDNWVNHWPDSLKPGTSGTDKQEQVFSLYLYLIADEMRLLLHHPSLSFRRSPMFDEAAFNASNIETCLQTSRKMLGHVTGLRSLKFLDTTWYSSATLILAVITTLYIQDLRKDQLTFEEFSNLQGEMGRWLVIMGDLGTMFGSGKRLETAVKSLVDKRLESLNYYLVTRTAVSTAASALSQQNGFENALQQVGASNATQFGQGNPFVQQLQGNPNPVTANGQGQIHGPAMSTNEQNFTHYNYPEPPLNSYEANPYPTAAAAQALAAATATSSHQSQASHNPYVVAQAQSAPSTYAPQSAMSPRMSWKNFTQNISGQHVPQQDFHSASVLIGLRDRGQGSNASQAPVADMTGQSFDASGVQASAELGTWPDMIVGGQPSPVQAVNPQQNQQMKHD